MPPLIRWAEVDQMQVSLQRLGLPCVDMVQLYWNSYRWGAGARPVG